MLAIFIFIIMTLPAKYFQKDQFLRQAQAVYSYLQNSTRYL